MDDMEMIATGFRWFRLPCTMVYDALSNPNKTTVAQPCSTYTGFELKFLL
jgi:sulfite exporter TauE/SafE